MVEPAGYNLAGQLFVQCPQARSEIKQFDFFHLLSETAISKQNGGISGCFPFLVLTFDLVVTDYARRGVYAHLTPV